MLAEVADSAAARSLAAYARAARVPADEVVPGARTVLFDGVPDAGRARRAAGRLDAPSREPEPGALVEVPVIYDGADLADVAARWGTDVDGVVARHGEVEFVVGLLRLRARLRLPRRPAGASTPCRGSTARGPGSPPGRSAWPAAWCGVYPTASPGGWRLLGRTDAALWDPDRSQPALLAPGTRVRFVAA